MKRYFFLLLIFLILAPATAQDELYFPLQMPEEAEILSEYVSIDERLSLLRVFDELKSIYFYHPDEGWQIYEYPSDILEITGVRSTRADGTYLLQTTSDYGFAIENFWLFDPISGRFSRPEEACGLVRALPDEGYWVFINSESDNMRLCHTRTREISAILPHDIQRKINDSISDFPSCGAYRIEDFPNIRQVVLTSCPSERDLILHVFDLDTGEITATLDLPNADRLTIWSGLHGYGKFLLTVEYWIAPDDSAYETSIRDEWVFNFRQNTFQKVIDNANHTWKRWEDGVGATGTIALYYDEQHVSVKFYDWINDTEKILFESDCSELPFSCVLLLHTNKNDDLSAFFLTQVTDEGYQNYLVSVEQNAIIYHINAPSHYIDWLDNETVVWLNSRDFQGEWNQLVIDTTGNFTHSILGRGYGLSQNRQYMFYWDSEQNIVYINDLHTDTLYPIITLPEGFYAVVGWAEDGDILATITRGRGGPGSPVAKWKLKVSLPSEEDLAQQNG